MAIRSPFPFAVLLASSLASPAVASVVGTLHINAGYMHQSSSLVPEKEVVFGPDTPPETLEFQQDFTTGEPPAITYGRMAQTQMDGEDGFLTAYASAELNGIPPSSSNSLGIYGEAELFGFDTFAVTSEVLEEGAEVELGFSMVVLGNGRVESRMYIDRIEGGGATRDMLSLSYSDNGGGGVNGVTEGSFIAHVGEFYRIEYTLLVSVGLVPFGMNESNSTRFLVSDYPTARYYGGPVDSSGAVVLDTTSGHDYTPAPEPAATASALAAMSALALHRIRDRRRSTR